MTYIVYINPLCTSCSILSIDPLFHFLFIRYFSQVDVCHYHPDWHSIRVCGRLPPYAPSHLQVLTFEIFAPTEISLCLYQPSYR